jgi:cytosine/adenosine deaminase-related metal-dependent hydrolase
MILRAKYVMPSSHEVFEDGAIVVEGDELVEVGTYASVRKNVSGETADLGEVALLPGFINAHTHLELGGLAGALPPPKRFTDWIRAVRFHRESADIERSVAAGVRDSLRGGATTVVDVTSTGLSVTPLRQSPIRKLVHFEALGFDGARAASSLAELRRRLDETPNDPLLTVGVSPHAPYSTSPGLYRECVRLSAERGYPLCSHVAETLDEEAFTRDGSGDFRELLESLGISLSDWEPPGTTPVQYLHSLGFFSRAPLLVHGNYIRNEDIPVLRDLNITVVYCPRSHAYFGHERHPFEKLFALGVNVAVGTDSLASAPSLSMLDELRFLYRRHQHVSPERVLTFAMLNGAKSLKVGARIGGLRAGWKADVVAIRLPTGGRRIAERILAEESEVALTMVGGVVAYRSPE